MTNQNTYKTARSLASTSAEVVEQLSRVSVEQPGPPSLAVLFASHHSAEQLDEIVPALSERLGAPRLIGCTAETVVAGDQEIEDQPAFSLWTAWLPEGDLHAMHLRFERTAEGGVITGWPDQLHGAWPEGSTLLLLGEPFSFPADLLLARLNEDQSGVRVLGGMASGCAAPGDARLVFGDRVVREGAVGVLLGNVPVTPVVSQGCRPIGEPLVITKAERNVIHQLGGKPARVQLQRIHDSLPNREKELMQRGIHLGRVVNEYQDRFEYGDFLIRNVTGASAEDDSILVGDFFRAGQTVQFHVRDATTAHEDLQQLLQQASASSETPRSGLLFTCNGRGTRLFDGPHHDARSVAGMWHQLPVAGMSCQGELGPIGGKNFLHGFTASVGLFH